ncbi:hypothetical protein FQR65_LT05669 [Abscondita terminalis]|nr:hypothetical protein FQR65_LT05669 [Abscondita terminalis]
MVNLNLYQQSGRNMNIDFFADVNYKFIKVEKVGRKRNVGLITFNSPKSLNALSYDNTMESARAMKGFDNDESVRSIIITGNERAFVAGGDIKELVNVSFQKCIKDIYLNRWDEITRTRKPLIAAVNGYAVGGGCELAMMCDIIYAGDRAKFGQPEILLGTIPGAGGTQRLTRTIGKSKAMELVLTGDFITAEEAERIGLVSRVFPPEKLLNESIKLAEKIAENSPVAVSLARDCVNAGLETTLSEGLRLEKKAFYGICNGQNGLL